MGAKIHGCLSPVCTMCIICMPPMHIFPYTLNHLGDDLEYLIQCKYYVNSISHAWQIQVFLFGTFYILFSEYFQSAVGRAYGTLRYTGPILHAF